MLFVILNAVLYLIVLIKGMDPQYFPNLQEKFARIPTLQGFLTFLSTHLKLNQNTVRNDILFVILKAVLSLIVLIKGKDP